MLCSKPSYHSLNQAESKICCGSGPRRHVNEDRGKSRSKDNEEEPALPSVLPPAGQPERAKRPGATALKLDCTGSSPGLGDNLCTCSFIYCKMEILTGPTLQC